MKTPTNTPPSNPPEPSWDMLADVRAAIYAIRSGYPQNQPRK